MKRKLSATAFLVLLAFISCTTLKRYNSSGQEATDNSLADAELFGYTLTSAKPASPEKTLWDLSADAQAQYIKILNTRYPENARFLQAMNFRYLNDESAFPESDEFVRKDLRIIFSVTRQHDYGVSVSGLRLTPADRIEYLKISLAIPADKGMKFTGWNMFTTEYGSVDIGETSFSRNLEVNVAGVISSGTKGSEGEISAGAVSSGGKKEEQEIKYRFLKLNGRLKDNEIQMEEEGTREIDLTGNLIADISLEFEKFPVMLTRITNLQDSCGRFSKPESLKMSHTFVFVPRMENGGDTIVAELSMNYIFRHVIRGQKTFPEWDDRIRYYKGTVTKMVTLFSSADYMPGFYCIGRNSGTGGTEIITLSGQDKTEIALVFSCLDEANFFYHWLYNFLTLPGNKGKTITVSGLTFRLGKEDLTSGLAEESDGIRLLPYYRQNTH